MDQSSRLLSPRQRRAPALPRPPALDLAGAALFADLDGTLAAIEPHPDPVGPEPGRTELLAELSRVLNGRLAVVSGRSLDDLDRVLQGAVTSIGAVHGLVRRTADGRVQALAPHPGLAAALDDLRAFALLHAAVWIEDKRHAAAIHYRAAPDLAADVLDFATEVAARRGLVLQPGRMVAELRSPGADKGATVAAFMTEPPFRGARPVFIGDDLTDEHGFAEAARLGGYGVLVGRSRATAAAYRLPGVAAALGWLRASLEG